MLEGLRPPACGSTWTPEGTFYCWGGPLGLPASINDGMGFFDAALERKGDLRTG